MFKKTKKIVTILTFILIITVTLSGSNFYNLGYVKDVLGENTVTEEIETIASEEKTSEETETPDEILSSEESVVSEETMSLSETEVFSSTESSEEISEEIFSEETTETPVEETTEETKVPIIKNFSVTESGLGVMNVKWEASDSEKVTVEWSFNNDFSGGKSKTIDASKNEFEVSVSDFWSKDIYVRITPIKENIKGETVSGKYKLWDVYLPGNVEAKNIVFDCSQNRKPDVKIKNRKGEYISADYYYVEAAPNKVGVGFAKIKFRDKYKGVNDIQVKCTVNPSAPRYFSISSVKKTEMNFYCSVSKTSTMYNYLEVRYADNRDFKNSKTVNFKPKDSTTTKRTISGLKKNTTYYVKARYVKIIGDKKYKSPEYTDSFKTAGSPPSTSVKNKVTKSLLNSIKKNKSFYIEFPQLISVQEAFDYVDAIMEPRPQYDKFELDYHFKNGCVDKIKMVYKSSMAKKANKVKTKINSIVKGAKKKKGTTAKVKYVNKRMCQMCSYDWAAYRYNGNSDKYDYAYEAYGCLVKGKAVCSGYAKAFSAIMTELNIPVKRVSTSDHTWNKVKVGKKWLHVDVTWNDCTNSTKWLLKKTHKN